MMRGLMRTRLAILLCFIGLVVSGSAADFLWRTESITAEVRRDDKFLKMGQYLHLQQKLQKGEGGWTMMKIDLPEHWTLEQVSVGDGKVSVRTKGGALYVLTKDNVDKMDFEILDGGNKSNDALEKIWKMHALQPSA